MIGLDPVAIPGSELRCRRLMEEDAQAICRWRYPGAWAAYDLDPDDPEAAERLLASEPPHQALVLASGELVGYFCVGEAARVSGGRYEAGALDLGLGLRPDLVGRGKGASWARAIVRFASRKWRAPRMRATIASWNKRALRTAHFIGFRAVGAFGGFRRGSSGHFIVLVRDPPGLESGVEFSHLPGGDLVAKGLQDLASSTETVEALLVSIAAPRLRDLGILVAAALPDAEHRLYERLAREEPDSAHSRYNALLRRLTSFESALECVG